MHGVIPLVKKAYRSFLPAIAVLLIAVSCSGISKNTDSISVVTGETARYTGHDSGHFLWGYYEISGNTETGDVKVIPSRIPAGHWNVLKWLEQGPCTNCVSTTNIQPGPNGTIYIDVTIVHPFATATLTGFDVRGIVLFNGSKTFINAGVTVPDGEAGDGELVNADGYTGLYHLLTAGSGPGGLQGYLTGKLASDPPPDASLNGYKRHVSLLAFNTRNAFYSNSSIKVTYQLNLPDGDFIFGYAVDANWAMPTVQPVNDPMVDFPPQANCPEPWKIEITEEPVDIGLHPAGGQTKLLIDVYDWQGKNSHALPVIECPEIFNGTKVASWMQDDTGFSRFEVDISNENLAPSGKYKSLVYVVDNENATSPAWLDLIAYQIYELKVSNGAWAVAWGGTGLDQASSVATDTADNIIVAGSFQGIVDLDPGDDIDMHYTQEISLTDYGVYVSKFNQQGEYIWGVDFGGEDNDLVFSVVTGLNDNIYITGSFDGQVDFNPGTGTKNLISKGTVDIYVSKFNSLGVWQWSVSVGDIWEDRGTAIACDISGNVYVGGTYRGTVDFDPSGGIDEHTSVNGNDSFLLKLDTDGNFIWAKTWGGLSSSSFNDSVRGVDTDTSSYIYVVGNYEGTTDFDPGPGVDQQPGPGGYLSRFASGGSYQWVQTWDGTGERISVDISGNALITGADEGVIARKYSSFGTLSWDILFGGYDGPFEADMGYGIGTDTSGNVFVTGIFYNTRDFDPSDDESLHTSHGISDIYIASFDPFGVLQWVNTVGGVAQDYGRALAVDSEGFPIIAGWFTGSVDFNPGSDTNVWVVNGGIDAFLEKFPTDGGW